MNWHTVLVFMALDFSREVHEHLVKHRGQLMELLLDDPELWYDDVYDIDRIDQLKGYISQCETVLAYVNGQKLDIYGNTVSYDAAFGYCTNAPYRWVWGI